MTQLAPHDFEWVTALFEARTGIRLGRDKEGLVVSRLLPRVRVRGVGELQDYLRLLREPSEEAERAKLVDQLTTHETYFFREPQHFAVLHKYARDHRQAAPLRVWSAACSSGEEAATVALVLEEAALPHSYEVVGTDIAPDVVRRADRGVFPLERLEGMDPLLLQKHCLRGVGEALGTFCLKPNLRKKMRFQVGNLLESLSVLGAFDVIFLRNVLIYFDDARRRRIVGNVLERLRPGGLLLSGHADTVRDCSAALKSLGPSTFLYEPGRAS